MKVKEFMTKDLTAVEPETPIKELVYLLDKSGLVNVPVIDEDERIVGMISERDVIEAALPGYFEMLHSSSFLPDINQFSNKLTEIEDEPVQKYMSEDVIMVNENEDDLYTADIMIRRNLKRIPVVNDDGILVGIVRRIDLLQGLLE
ncbi:MAG: HPP family protein [Candidatus Bipolaricaulia bacterium]